MKELNSKMGVMKMKEIILIIPAYNEANSIEALIKRLDSVIESLSNYHFQYLFVNDGSVDDTLLVLQEKSKNHPLVSYLDLSRNFGKETAMLAGLDYADSDAVIILDADLQHPPEVIPKMIDYWEEGYEDIYAIRERSKDKNKIKNAVSEIYYKFLQKLTKEKVYPNVGDFRLLDRKCVLALRELRESERYMKGMYSWIGFRKKEVYFKEEDRMTGSSKWSFIDLFKLAIDGFTSYSTVPLKIWSYIGILISLLSFIFLFFEIVKTLVYGTSPSGYPTLLAAIIFLGGIQLISLGVIGEYLGRVFIETKGRPTYFIREKNVKESEALKDEQTD